MIHSNKARTTASVTRHPLSGLTLAAMLALMGAGPAEAQSTAGAQTEYAKGRILVMPRAGLPDAALARILNENGNGKARRIGQSDLHIVDLPPGLEKQSVEKLSRHPHIKFAELDRFVEHALATNDPYLGSQWHTQKIGAPAAWDATLGSGVTIAILDTGVDSAHPDLAAVLVPGWNLYDNNSNTADVYGHGTKVAGAAAAAANNAVGVVGVAGAAKIMPIRISDASGMASLSTMAQGLTWAADRGAKVANLSYFSADSAAVNSAAQYMKSKGGLVTTSAGNSGVDMNTAATNAMIPVSATDANDARASWSNFGAYVALSAPGVGIYTTVKGGGYGAVSGTSFSAPITAGVIALMMSVKPALPNTTVEGLLYSTALDLGAAGRDAYYGYGRVNASAAVLASINAAATMDTTAPLVSVLAPLGSSTVNGIVSVDLSASDNVSVSKVDLLVDGKVLVTDSSPPFAFSWDSTKVGNGSHTLAARAYDAAGNVGNSAVVTVNVANPTVADTTPPVVAISNPANGSKVSGTVSVKVAASDNSGAAGITQSLSINGKVVAAGTGGALSYSWNTRKAAAGTYTLTAVARDAAGNTSSTQVSVTR